MAEFTNTPVQLVAEDANVTFAETPVRGCKCIDHREGSGVVTLRGNTNCCYARYRVSFGGNIAIPTGGTVEPISVAISVRGEALGSATAILTPTAVETYGNVYISVLVDVPRGCCLDVGVVNTSDQAINVQNANLIVDREGE